MCQQNLADQASLITGFRVGGRPIRGWSQPNENSQGLQSANPASISSQKSLEEWYKAHYFDYYFRAYKSNGLDDATSSQYAHSCVVELERTGYIQNVIQTQMGVQSGAQNVVHESAQSGFRPNPRSNRPSAFHSGSQGNSNRDKTKGLQNWIYRLFSTYRSNGTSREDIEWNQKLSSYSQYVSERYKNSNKVIDWDLQNLPRREVIQNFKVRTGFSENGGVASSFQGDHSGSFDAYKSQIMPAEASLANDLHQSPVSSSYQNFGGKRNRDKGALESGYTRTFNVWPKNKRFAEESENTTQGVITSPSPPTEFDSLANDRSSRVPESNILPESEGQDYILDANGNKRLSWQQILILAKSTEKIVGLSTALEKQYLRLTSCPDPNLVRPEHVLKKSLEFTARPIPEPEEIRLEVP
ncbi:SAC3/GANP family protein [Cryptosporidium felis]|nr:SAC3/GANP family protein [Cryptosporidium felis]